MTDVLLAIIALLLLAVLITLLRKWEALPVVWQLWLAVAFMIAFGIGGALALYYVIVPWAVEWAITAWSELPEQRERYRNGWLPK
jgi:hypothetical protein